MSNDDEDNELFSISYLGRREKVRICTAYPLPNNQRLPGIAMLKPSRGGKPGKPYSYEGMEVTLNKRNEAKSTLRVHMMKKLAEEQKARILFIPDPSLDIEQFNQLFEEVKRRIKFHTDGRQSDHSRWILLRRLRNDYDTWLARAQAARRTIEDYLTTRNCIFTGEEQEDGMYIITITEIPPGELRQRSFIARWLG